jgi:hypothetical protein
LYLIQFEMLLPAGISRMKLVKFKLLLLQDETKQCIDTS